MAHNLNQSSNDSDEINLREIIKILIESKKLIVSTILFFAIASIIFSVSLNPSFKTSTNLEIGYSPKNNGERDYIESASNLISHLKVLLISKNSDDKLIQEVSMESFEDKIIIFKTTSNSAEQNENFLTEIISYIDKRHSNLSLLKNKSKTGQISLNLETVNSEIAFIKEKQIGKNKEKKLAINLELDSVKSQTALIKEKQIGKNNEKKLAINLELDSVNSQTALIKEKQLSDIEGRLYILTNELPIIDLEISQLEKVIMENTNNFSLLEGNNNMLKARAANSMTLEEIIFTYKSKINALNRQKSSYISEAKTLNNKLENVLLQSQELFNLAQEQKTLENQLMNLNNQAKVNTRLIKNIKTEIIKPRYELIISLGLFFGFFSGIFLVFTRNFIRNL